MLLLLDDLADDDLGPVDDGERLDLDPDAREQLRGLFRRNSVQVHEVVEPFVGNFHWRLLTSSYLFRSEIASTGVPTAKPWEAGFGPKPLKRRRAGSPVRQTLESTSTENIESPW